LASSGPAENQKAGSRRQSPGPDSEAMRIGIGTCVGRGSGRASEEY